jgi:BMFP domain-containing protein YqiC
MQTDNRLFDDLARVANGAINTLSGVREEIESRLRERVERWLTEMDMVPREEFEAIKEIAQKARAEQEDLSVKVAALEQQLAAVAGGAAKPRKRAASAPKAPSRPAAKAGAKRASKSATRRRTTDAKPAG